MDHPSIPREVNPIITGLKGPGDVSAIAGWWSNTPGLGQDRQETFPSRANQILQVTGVDALGPPAPYTVTLHAAYQYGEGANCAFRARVKIGAGASMKIIECDFANGAQLAIAGSGQLSVAAVSYAPNPAADYDAAGSKFQLGASIGHSTGGHPQPYYSQRLLQLAASTPSPIISPPLWAESVQVLLMNTSESLVDPYVQAVRLKFYDQAGNVFAVMPANKFAGLFIPVPNGSRVGVDNGVDNETRDVTLMWRLAM